MEQFVRIVFEKGIELRCTREKQWAFQSVSEKNEFITSEENPEEIPHKLFYSVYKKYNVRPILLTSSYSGSEHSMLLPSIPMRSLDVEWSELYRKNSRDISFQHLSNLSYSMGTMLYHCKQLAEVYCRICRSFVSSPFDQLEKDDKAIYGGNPETYFEFDALVTDVIRLYEVLRYVIWIKFGIPKNDVPRSYEDMLKKIPSRKKDFPSLLFDRLNDNWSTIGDRAKKYRNCLQHNTPIIHGIPYVRMSRLDDKVWSASIWIPDNPEDKSQVKFIYDSEIDALTYGWELTSEMVKLVKMVVDVAPETENMK
jgi:hypothetical protein